MAGHELLILPDVNFLFRQASIFIRKIRFQLILKVIFRLLLWLTELSIQQSLVHKSTISVTKHHTTRNNLSQQSYRCWWDWQDVHFHNARWLCEVYKVKEKLLVECFRPIAPASVTAQPDGCRMFFLTQSEHFLAAFSFWCQRRRGVPGEISQSIDFLGFSSLFPPPSLRSQKILEDLHGKQERADKGTLISVLWRVKRGFLFLQKRITASVAPFYHRCRRAEQCRTICSLLSPI